MRLTKLQHATGFDPRRSVFHAQTVEAQRLAKAEQDAADLIWEALLKAPAKASATPAKTVERGHFIMDMRAWT